MEMSEIMVMSAVPRLLLLLFLANDAVCSKSYVPEYSLGSIMSEASRLEKGIYNTFLFIINYALYTDAHMVYM